jgi:hypothetical protein
LMIFSAGLYSHKSSMYLRVNERVTLTNITFKTFYLSSES